MLAITDIETGSAVVALLIIVAAILTLVRIFTGRESRWKRVRFGLFVERIPLDTPDIESGWDEEDTVEIEPLRYQQHYPSREEGK